jgi:hypothetical protein
VGALRELKSKVGPVYEALAQLVISTYATAYQEWIHYQDDAISLLRQADVLDKIIGREPPLPPGNAMTIAVDEFGRDVQSQFLRDRSKRYSGRMRRLHHKESNILSFLWVEDKMHEGNGRFDILQQALRVAIDDLDKEYSSLQKLMEIFEEWKRQYPEEYHQCYANLSLGDLSTILVLSEFCGSTWLFDLMKSNNDDNAINDEGNDGIFSAIHSLQKMESDTDLEENGDSPAQRVLERNHVVFFVKLLKESSSACFFSTFKSRMFSSFLGDIVTKLNNKKEAMGNIQQAILSSFQETLGSIAIPILKQGVNDKDAASLMQWHGEDENYLKHAINFAKNEQVLCIQCLLLNMLTHWLHHIQSFSNYDEIVICLLEFISNKFLLFLSSMPLNTASSIFASIWKILNTDHPHLLESPALIIQSAPIRAAAMAYGFS